MWRKTPIHQHQKLASKQDCFPHSVLQRGYSNTGYTAVILSICPSVCPSLFDLMNIIETKLSCASPLNLAEILIMIRGWTLLKKEVKGQGHYGQI